jgi:hypothetical protein
LGAPPQKGIAGLLWLTRVSFTLEALKQNAEAAPFEQVGQIHCGSAKQSTDRDKKEG